MYSTRAMNHVSFYKVVQHWSQSFVRKFSGNEFVHTFRHGQATGRIQENNEMGMQKSSFLIFDGVHVANSMSKNVKFHDIVQ